MKRVTMVMKREVEKQHGLAIHVIDFIAIFSIYIFILVCIMKYSDLQLYNLLFFNLRFKTIHLNLQSIFRIDNIIKINYPDLHIIFRIYNLIIKLYVYANLQVYIRIYIDHKSINVQIS